MEIEVLAPITDEDLEAYTDVVGQQVIVWTKCTGENDTPVEADYATEAAAVEVVKAKQATMVKKLELSLVKGEVEDPRGGDTDSGDSLGRGDAVEGGNITRGT